MGTRRSGGLIRKQAVRRCEEEEIPHLVPSLPNRYNCNIHIAGKVKHDDINQVRHGTGWEDCYSINSVVAVEFLQNLVDGGCVELKDLLAGNTYCCGDRCGGDSKQENGAL